MQTPELVAITKLYVLVLVAGESGQAGIIFATECPAQTVAEAQDEANNATIELTLEADTTLDDEENPA